MASKEHDCSQMLGKETYYKRAMKFQQKSLVSKKNINHYWSSFFFLFFPSNLQHQHFCVFTSFTSYLPNFGFNLGSSERLKNLLFFFFFFNKPSDSIIEKNLQEAKCASQVGEERPEPTREKRLGGENALQLPKPTNQHLGLEKVSKHHAKRLHQQKRTLEGQRQQKQHRKLGGLAKNSCETQTRENQKTAK